MLARWRSPLLTARLKELRRTKLYDLVAVAPLLAWYLYCAVHMLPPLLDQFALIRLFVRTDPSVLPATLVLSTISHAGTLVFFVVLIVMFAVRHIPQRTAPGFYSRFAAVSGTLVSAGFVLLPLQELSFGLYLTSLVLIIIGTTLAIWAALVLGRSISLFPEARRLVIGGPYALVRHPLYLGEMIAVTGVALQYWSEWALLLFGLVCMFQLQRIKYEEQVLSEMFPEYRDYMARTDRLVPGVY